MPPVDLEDPKMRARIQAAPIVDLLNGASWRISQVLQGINGDLVHHDEAGDIQLAQAYLAEALRRMGPPSSEAVKERERGKKPGLSRAGP